MSRATEWARERATSEAARPMLIIQGYPDPAATITDNGQLTLPHATQFDARSAKLLAQWILETFS